MEEKRKRRVNRQVRKWVRLTVAIVASVFLLNKPVFSFPDEIGLEHVRTHTMTPHRFERHHIEMATGIDKLVGSMSVQGLYYCAIAILIGCIACVVVYESHRLRILACTITAFIAGTYYLIMFFYAIKMTQAFFLMLYPNFYALLPVTVMIIMLSIRKETVHRLLAAKIKADEGE